MLEEEALSIIYGENIEAQVQDLMAIFRSTLLDYAQTEGFNAIPKTEDFMILCIDHDEDIAQAQEKLDALMAVKILADNFS